MEHSNPTQPTGEYFRLPNDDTTQSQCKEQTTHGKFVDDTVAQGNHPLPAGANGVRSLPRGAIGPRSIHRGSPVSNVHSGTQI